PSTAHQIDHRQDTLARGPLWTRAISLDHPLNDDQLLARYYDTRASHATNCLRPEYQAYQSLPESVRSGNGPRTFSPEGLEAPRQGRHQKPVQLYYDNPSPSTGYLSHLIQMAPG